MSRHKGQHTHTFNGPLSGTARVSRHQKGKTNLDFTEATDSEWQWHQLGHMQVYTSLQTDNHASTSLLSFFTGRMPFLSPNQQRQRTTLIEIPCGFPVGKLMDIHGNTMKATRNSQETRGFSRKAMTCVEFFFCINI